MRPRYFIFLFVIICLTFISLSQASEEKIQLDELLDKIEGAFNSQNKADWQTIILTSITEFDKKGNTVKVTKMKRRMVVKDRKTESEILEALEIKDGKTTNITGKLTDRNKKRSDENKNQGVSVSWEQVVPFNKKDRDKYVYQRLDDSILNGKPVFVIETEAKDKNVNAYEGKYYFDKDLYKIVKISVKPSETPMFVKDVYLEINFKLMNGNNATIDNIKSEVKGRILFKRFHVLIEEKYTQQEFI